MQLSVDYHGTCYHHALINNEYTGQRFAKGEKPKAISAILLSSFDMKTPNVCSNILALILLVCNCIKIPTTMMVTEKKNNFFKCNLAH